MKLLKILTPILFFLMMTITINACVSDDNFETPPTKCHEKWTANKSIAQIIAYNPANATPFLITEDAVFEAYVISSDEKGNFFKTISLQDSPTKASVGIQIELDATNLYTKFPVGKKVLIHAKGLYIAKDAGVIKLGQTYDYNGTKRVGRLDEVEINNHILAGCADIVKPEAKNFSDISLAKKDANLNTLITLENVQFITTDIGKQYGAPTTDAFGGAVDRTIVDAYGNKIAVRTSTFAKFSKEFIPNKKGKITAVLSKYNTTYQLVLRSFEDIALTDDLATDFFVEDFESITNTGNGQFVNLPNWQNISINNGTEKWGARTFGTNQYAQISAFGTTETNMEVWLVSPAIHLNNTTQETLSFETKDAYNNGDALEVYISTNFDGSNIKLAAWTKLNAKIAKGATTGYAANFTTSGDLDLSSYQGDVYIGFKYKGSSAGIKTTYQLDNIKVKGL